MKFLNLIKKIEKGKTFLLMLVVGSGFLLFTLLPLFFNDWQVEGSMWVSFLFGAAGLAMIVISIINLKKVLTTTLEENNYFDKVDKNVDPEVVERIRTSTSPVDEYYFHFCGKLNQSYILETPEREPVYEFICDKMGIVNQYVFTFKNHLTGEETSHNVSHTVSTSYGGENYSIVDTSYFKIDDQNIWDYIADMGYSVEPYLDSLMFSFRIRHYGVEVADLKAAGTNILEQYEDRGGLRDVPMMQGLYRVSCRDEDIEAVAIIAFAVSRVQVV